MKRYREESVEIPQLQEDQRDASVLVKVKDVLYGAVDVLASVATSRKEAEKQPEVLAAVNFKPVIKPSLQAIKSLEFSGSAEAARVERKRKRRLDQTNRQELFTVVKVR